MRISVKVAPGVRVSGRVGGRGHHHRSAGLAVGGGGRPSGDWLHNIPPWRMPRLRVNGIGSAIGLLIMAEVFALIWFYEAMILLCVWFAYGAFLGARWIYRNNIIGKTIMAAKRRGHAPVDPNARPVDLAATARYGAVPGDPYASMGLPSDQAATWQARSQPEDPWGSESTRRRG